MKPKLTPTEKNAKVLAVLAAATEPLGPSRIAELIGEPWCMGACVDNPSYPLSSVITPILRRVGAVRVPPGRYLFPKK